jgi:hypothetical protein
MSAPSKLLLGQDREPPFDQVDPGEVGGREVEMEAGVPEQPAVDQRRLVGAVVVEHEMHLQVGRHLPLSMRSRKLQNSVARCRRCNSLPPAQVSWVSRDSLLNHLQTRVVQKVTQDLISTPVAD